MEELSILWFSPHLVSFFHIHLLVLFKGLNRPPHNNIRMQKFSNELLYLFEIISFLRSSQRIQTHMCHTFWTVLPSHLVTQIHKNCFKHLQYSMYDSRIIWKLSSHCQFIMQSSNIFYGINYDIYIVRKWN